MSEQIIGGLAIGGGALLIGQIFWMIKKVAEILIMLKAIEKRFDDGDKLFTTFITKKEVNDDIDAHAAECEKLRRIKGVR